MALFRLFCAALWDVAGVMTQCIGVLFVVSGITNDKPEDAALGSLMVFVVAIDDKLRALLKNRETRPEHGHKEEK